jgi:hypothetical protein
LLPDEIRQPGDGRGVRDLEAGAEIIPEGHPELGAGLQQLRKVSRACLRASERVSPEILRLVTKQRMALSEPLLCSGISGRSSTSSSSALLARPYYVKAQATMASHAGRGTYILTLKQQ